MGVEKKMSVKKVKRGDVVRYRGKLHSVMSVYGKHATIIPKGSLFLSDEFRVSRKDLKIVRRPKRK